MLPENSVLCLTSISKRLALKKKVKKKKRWWVGGGGSHNQCTRLFSGFPGGVIMQSLSSEPV